MTTTFNRAMRTDLPDSLWTGYLAAVPPETTHLAFDGKVKGLERLHGLDRLVSIHLRDAGDATLVALAGAPRLTELHLFNLRITTLAPLAAHANLTALHLEACTKLTDLGPLTALAATLTELKVGDLARVTDLAPLAALTRLKALCLTCGVFKTWKVATLEPLRALTGLSELQLEGVVPADGDLRPLTALRGLAELHMSPMLYPLRDYARLVSALPQTQVWPAAPYTLQSPGEVDATPDPTGPWLVPTGQGARVIAANSPKAAALKAKREAEWAAWIAHYARHDPATDTATMPAS